MWQRHPEGAPHTTFSVHDDQVIEEQIDRADDRIGITVSEIFPPAGWPLLPLACIPNTIASNPPRRPFAIAPRAIPIPTTPRLQFFPCAKKLPNRSLIHISRVLP